MIKKHKFVWIGVIATAILAAAVGSFARAQSGSGSAQATDTGGTVVSRHVDYNVNLQVNGDLSAVSPKLQGVLPLNLTATGGADVKKGDSGPAAQGTLQIGGLDTIVQQLTGGDSANGQKQAIGSMVSNALSDLQFVELDHTLYLKIAGSWYDLNGLGRHGKPGDDAKAGAAGSGSGKHRADIKGAFPGGITALLKDQQTAGQEDIDGVTTTHYTASIDVDKAVTEAVTALNSAGKADKANKLAAAKPQVVAAAKQMNVEWWIDADGNIRQVKTAFEVDPAPLAGLLDGQTGKAAEAESVLKDITSVKLDATVKFSHFGEDFQIAKPDGDIKPIKDLAALAGFSHGDNGNGQASDARRHKNGQNG